MKIAVDLRSLSSGSISGVENYCLNLLEHLLPLDKKNSYTLFYNSFAKQKLGDFHFINSEIKNTRWPNKFVNLGLKLGVINLERLAGDFDCFFMPNLNQFNIKPGKKLVITVHDLSPVVTPEFYDLKRRIWHKFLNYKKAFNRADVLLTVSEHTKRDLIKIFNINADKIKVIYPAVEQKNFNSEISEDELRLARNIYGLPGDYILFLNTIEPRKNLANLINAFERLNSSVKLVIAGKVGWKYKKDFEMIKNSKKSAKIKYVGYIEEQHKPAVIKMAKALVYPSFYEGFGFQPLEAMSVGTPVIGSQVTSVPEVLGNSGILVNPYSVEDLNKSLVEVLTNNGLRTQLISKGLLQAQKFNWEKTASKTLEVLNNL